MEYIMKNHSCLPFAIIEKKINFIACQMILAFMAINKTQLSDYIFIEE
jgi:hypothetical protein